MTLDDIAAILYLISIPVFIVGIITLIIQFIRKKKKKVPLIMLLVSVLLFVGCLGLPLFDDQEEPGKLNPFFHRRSGSICQVFFVYF